MTDPAAVWLASMIRTGETVITLRQAGHTWREITDELHLGDVQTVHRAAAMFLASDYASRRTHGEAAGEAPPVVATSARPQGERAAARTR